MQLTYEPISWPNQRARQMVGTLLHARTTPPAPHGQWPLTWECCYFLVTSSVLMPLAVCRTRQHQDLCGPGQGPPSSLKEPCLSLDGFQGTQSLSSCAPFLDAGSSLIEVMHLREREREREFHSRHEHSIAPCQACRLCG